MWEYMQAVLGIDAAWTVMKPSGVALAACGAGGWELVEAESSYQNFCARVDSAAGVEIPLSGSLPVTSALLATCQVLSGRLPELVAIDMPLSLSPICGRRASDEAVSRAYGAYWCATHTPSASRPGQISDRLRADFEKAGYPLQTEVISTPGLIEVFPHPALVELASAEQRLPYKAGKVGKYWPTLGRGERRDRLYRQWNEIVSLLDSEIKGVKDKFAELPLDAWGYEPKAFEDRLDAVVCAWVAICALKGQARAFGDEESAIWIPVAAN
jgi:predicted RNase H-like nuclease